MLIWKAMYNTYINFHRLLPESPRWLLRTKKVEEAHKVFSYIARINQTSPVTIETLYKVADLDGNSGDQNVKKISYVQFFKNKDTRFTTLCLMAIWSAWAVMYFGIGYNIKNIGSKIYLNMIFMGLSDAVGYPCSYFVNSMQVKYRNYSISMPIYVFTTYV